MGKQKYWEDRLNYVRVRIQKGSARMKIEKTKKMLTKFVGNSVDFRE